MVNPVWWSRKMWLALVVEYEQARLSSRGCDKTDWSGGVGHHWLFCWTPARL
jgi:hypothetical protein